MEFQPLPTQRKAQYVVDQIVRAIAGATYAVGDQLPPERELASMMNVGRSSVREALSMLQIAGVLEVRHGSGTFVRRVPEPGFDINTSGAGMNDATLGVDFLELSEARLAFEVGVVRLACTRREKRGLAKLDAALAAMESATEDGDGGKFLEANLDFHDALAACTSNRDIVRLSQVLLKALRTPGVRRMREFYYSVEPGRMKATLDAHERLARAVREGDSELAEEALEQHYVSLAKPLRDASREEGNEDA